MDSLKICTFQLTKVPYALDNNDNNITVQKTTRQTLMVIKSSVFARPSVCVTCV